MKNNKPIMSRMLSFLSHYTAFFLCLVILIVGAIVSPNFLTIKNIMTVLKQSSIIGVMACGLSIVIIAGAIDISSGTILSFIVIAYAYVDKLGLPFIVQVIVVILIGMVIGLLNGTLINTFNLTPFIVTMGMGTALEGITYIMCNARAMYANTHSGILGVISSSKLFGFIPVLVLLLVFAAMVGQLLLNRTALGFHWKSIGGNREAAYWAGIKTKKVSTLSFVAEGAFIGFAAVLTVARTNVCDPTIGSGMSLNAIASVVLGGTFMGGGGRGTVVGCILGAFILGTVNNLLTIANVSSYWQYVVSGIIVIIAMIIGNVDISVKAKE